MRHSEQGDKAASNDFKLHQVWFIDPNQFDEPIRDPFIDVEIHSECEARQEALRIARKVHHRIIVETKTPERAWYGYEKDFIIFPWQDKGVQ